MVSPLSFPAPERWSRGCGSGGLGPVGNGQIDGYSAGILSGVQWVEVLGAKDYEASGLSLRVPAVNSTQRVSYTTEGKFGAELAIAAHRQDRELNNDGQSGDILSRHGDFNQPPMDCSATLNTLTFGEKQAGEPSVQAYLWDGSNRHSRTVPVKQSSLSLTRTKVAQWQADSDPSGTYRTSSRAAALASALPAASHPCKTSTIMPAAEGGQLAQIGRKPCGASQVECDKNYRRLGLRDTYCTFLTAPKH